MGHFEQKHEMPASTEAGSRRKGRHSAGQSPSHGSLRLLRRANRIDKQNRKGGRTEAHSPGILGKGAWGEDKRKVEHRTLPYTYWIAG